MREKRAPWGAVHDFQKFAGMTRWEREIERGATQKSPEINKQHSTWVWRANNLIRNERNEYGVSEWEGVNPSRKGHAAGMNDGIMNDKPYSLIVLLYEWLAK